MIYQNTREFALALDESDPLKEFASRFLVPKREGKDAIYLCGNSLGLQPVSAAKYVADQLSAWKDLGVEGWFQGDNPWLGYHKQLRKSVSRIVGANENEVSIMNSLTVNLHLLMVSFYQPTNKRFKIIMEGGAFPSDQYAMESQVKFHGLDPDKVIVEVFPRENEVTLRTEDILQAINDHADELALVLFGGINYYTGQFFDMQAITEAGHSAGAHVGFDLAHAAGNVPVQLHQWDVDFACWCSYKYMNSGPGGISGIFVHEKHFGDHSLKRFAGWWGYKEDKRFLMTLGFVPDNGAAGWQVSTSPILLLALHKAALDLFDEAGGISQLREKSKKLTGYLEYVISQVSQDAGTELFKIITPVDANERGCQLSVVCRRNAKAIFNFLSENGVIGDWREPDVIRLSPVPLYNTFKQVFDVGLILGAAAKEN